MFLVGASKGLVAKTFAIDNNRLQLRQIRNLVTPKMTRLRNHVSDASENQGRLGFLHGAKAALHEVLEPIAKVRISPHKKVINVNKHDANQVRVFQAPSSCSVQEVVIMDGLNEAKLVS